jgi:hypothetical protein
VRWIWREKKNEVGRWERGGRVTDLSQGEEENSKERHSSSAEIAQTNNSKRSEMKEESVVLPSTPEKNTFLASNFHQSHTKARSQTKSNKRSENEMSSCFGLGRLLAPAVALDFSGHCECYVSGGPS